MPSLVRIHEHFRLKRMLCGKHSDRTPSRFGKPLRKVSRFCGHSTLARESLAKVPSMLACSTIPTSLNSMTRLSLQETALNNIDLLSSISRSDNIAVVASINPSDLQICSQSLRSNLIQSSSVSYYGPSVLYGMQSTSSQDPKTCKKRNSASSLRHGFVGKKLSVSKKSNATNRIQCPEAPRNTTSFLIEDLEERECRDTSPPSPSVSPVNVRCSSSSVDYCTDKFLSSSFGDDTDVKFCDDYEFMSDVVSRERLSTLSRDEINRELKTVEEQKRDLIQHFSMLRQENDKLRELLKANGIDPPKTITSNC